MRFILDYLIPSMIVVAILFGIGWIIIKIITLIISLSWAWWLVYFLSVGITAFLLKRQTKN